MKGAWRIFINGFVKSLIFIIILSGAGVLSYHAIGKFFHIPEAAKGSLVPAIEKASITTASLEDISKNLIFCVDEDGSIEKLLLEVFHCENRVLCYFTLPVRTRITMSDSLYQDLVIVNPSTPQIMKLSGITKYFPEETAYEYGVLLIEDLLNIKISYYTVVPDSIHKTVFVTEERGKDAEAPREVFSEEYIEYVHTLQTEEDLKNYMEELYEAVRSNLTFSDKMNYLESYMKLTFRNITFELIAGENTNSAYIVDPDRAAKQLSRITGDRSGNE